MIICELKPELRLDPCQFPISQTRPHSHRTEPRQSTGCFNSYLTAYAPTHASSLPSALSGMSVRIRCRGWLRFAHDRTS
jgi:hypothetical protein